VITSLKTIAERRKKEKRGEKKKKKKKGTGIQVLMAGQICSCYLDRLKRKGEEKGKKKEKR